MTIKLPTQRDIQKLLPRQRDTLRMLTGKRIREPILASKKKKALEKAKGKCEWSKCSEKDILDYHHVNLKNDDNRPSNIKVLCPTHHRKIQQQIKRVMIKDITGREIKSKLIKTDSKSKKKKTKKSTKKPTKKKRSYSQSIYGNNFRGFGV